MAVLTTAVGYILGIWLLSQVLFVVLIQNALGNQRILDPVLKVLCRAIALSFGIRVRRSGARHLRDVGPCIFMANHVNIFDPIVLYGYLPVFVRAVELEDHFSWPVWGTIVKRAGFIPISHSDVTSAVRSLRIAADAVRRGTSIIILPEGHRTRDGELGVFMRGAFRLAKSAGAPVVPVAMKDAFVRKNVHSLRVRPGRMTVLIGRPILAAAVASSSERELRETVRLEIERLLA